MPSAPSSGATSATPPRRGLTYRLVLDESPDDRVAFAALARDPPGVRARGTISTPSSPARSRAPIAPAALRRRERAALLLRLAEVAAARGWLDRGGGPLRGDPRRRRRSSSDEILAAAERVARGHDDLALLQAVLERRVASRHRSRGGGDLAARAWASCFAGAAAATPPAAAGAFRRAASAAEPAGDAGARGAGFWSACSRSPPAIAPRPRGSSTSTARPKHGSGSRRCTRCCSAPRRPPRRPRACCSPSRRPRCAPARPTASWPRPTRCSPARARGRPRQRAAVRSARARVLARNPARFAEAAAAYRAILERAATTRPAPRRGRSTPCSTAQRRDGTPRRTGAGSSRTAPSARRRASAHPSCMAWAAAEEGCSATPPRPRRSTSAWSPSTPTTTRRSPRRRGCSSPAGRLRGRGRDAVERRRALACEGAARAALDLELAALLLDRLDQPAEALAAAGARAGGEPEPTPPRERLVERALARPSGGGAAPPAARHQAAEIIARAADAAEDVEAFAALMGVLLATPADDATFARARRGWFERVLDRPGLPPSRGLDVALLAASELPGDLSLWDRAEPLARAAQAPERLALAYRRALGVAAIRSPHSARPIPEPASPEDRRPRRPSPARTRRRSRRSAAARSSTTRSGSTSPRRRSRSCAASSSSYPALPGPSSGSSWCTTSTSAGTISSRSTTTPSPAPTSPDVRRELLEDAALAAKDLASDSARAMRYYEALYAHKPEPRVRTALERLYERHGRHRDLIALLTAELGALDGSLVSGVASGVDAGAAQKLRARIAQLWLDGAGEAEPAVAMVEQMLDAEPCVPRRVRAAGARAGSLDGGTREARRRAAAPAFGALPRRGPHRRSGARAGDRSRRRRPRRVPALRCCAPS